MATWRGHIAGSMGFLGLPVALLALLGAGGYVLDPPVAFQRGVRSVLQSTAPFVHFGRAGTEARVLWTGALLLVNLLFALFPDTDVAGARGRIATWSAAVAYGTLAWTLTTQAKLSAEKAAMLWFFLALFLAAVTAASMAEHRTWTHSIAAAVGIPLLVVGVPASFLLGTLGAALLSGSAILGYLSHLKMDGMLRRSWREMCRRLKRENGG